MIKNYFTLALRILKRQKIYSAINIFGLTTGVTASLLILLYVADELSYDRFHPDAGRIYRVDFHGKLQDEAFVTATTGLPAAEAIQRDASGVESVVRLDKWMTCPVRYEENTFTEMHFMLADSNFFSFFNFTLLQGNPKEALTGPNKIVISERAAARYFGYTGTGDQSPIGKMLVIGSPGNITAEVTGIAETPRHNSHIQYDFLMSLETSGYIDNPVWLNSEVYTYFKLFPGTEITTVQHTLDSFVEKYCARELQEYLNVSLDQFTKQGGHLGFVAVPMLDIHLRSQLTDELEPNGNIRYVYLFGIIAAFIVLLACINFMNLSTARSANRAKEIGVRKTIGAAKAKLVVQFILESFVYVCIAFAISVILVNVLLGMFNTLSGKELTAGMLLHPAFIGGFVVFMLVTGLLAGSYPAFYLTSFKPIEVLKGRIRAGAKSSGIRNTLVIFQFFISIALIISSIMVYNQLKFLQERSVGFNKENVVGLMHTMNLGRDAEAFKQEILKYPEFVAASFSARLPPNVDWFTTFKTSDSDANHLLCVYQADYDHLATLGLKMVNGRYFSRDFLSDTAAVILNEAAVRQMNLKDWQGKRILNSGAGDHPGFEIIGVVRDFNFESMRSNIRPLVMFFGPTPNWDIAVRLSPGNPEEKIKRLEALWKKYAPTAPFEYSFIDQNINAKFRAEQQLSSVIVVFTTLAVFIACLGLFGLATFTAEQRAKEISVRKIMGASVQQVVVLLSKEFAKLIMIAFIIALPVTWYSMNQWLQGFAYRIDFNLLVAALAGAIALVVSLITVSYHSIKAALRNPVNALRND
jgi:putative ABC transport system permease protein